METSGASLFWRFLQKFVFQEISTSVIQGIQAGIFFRSIFEYNF